MRGFSGHAQSSASRTSRMAASLGALLCLCGTSRDTSSTLHAAACRRLSPTKDRGAEYAWGRVGPRSPFPQAGLAAGAHCAATWCAQDVCAGSIFDRSTLDGSPERMKPSLRTPPSQHGCAPTAPGYGCRRSLLVNASLQPLGPQHSICKPWGRHHGLALGRWQWLRDFASSPVAALGAFCATSYAPPLGSGRHPWLQRLRQAYGGCPGVKRLRTSPRALARQKRPSQSLSASAACGCREWPLLKGCAGAEARPWRRRCTPTRADAGAALGPLESLMASLFRCGDA